MKNLLNSFLALLLLSAAFHSCIDKNYDLDNIDDNGNLSPALILPIGSLRISASELVSGAGIG
ncbi:MAG: hypothetical protein LBR10_04070, partial [Prevotellaceae bacterium]|nr:hypothetical protein [Prevotellaceae bacterium]